ncbi:MAG: DUF4832 domain-containing protein [Oscillospiraceae bacterium]|jgi:hypothetical protein|nr:DUF4832 domain-containing protein [Oscillospiraceae bacterium]
MPKEKTVIYPLAADYAFPNTMKGQRGQIGAGGKIFRVSDTEVYSRLYKVYFNWDELERTIDDDESFVRRVCDERFADCREHNVRIIPRVAIQWPNHGDHTKATEIVGRFPSDMVKSTLDTPEFFFRVRNLIEKLGRVWNDDPRIAYIETGIYGLWGEQHEDAMSKDAQRNLADAFHAAFPNKLCMIRQPRNCLGEGFGMYWDSFAHIDEEYYACDAVRFMDWRTAVMGGEVAHNWGRHEIQPGDDMNDTLTAPEHLDRFLDYVFWQHNNHLGVWMPKDERYAKALDGLSEYQKRAGHRYVMEKVEYGVDDGKLTVEFDVRNTGASPFYYNWPVSAALLDESGNAVWQGNLESADIRNWLPGDKWNFDKRAYDEPAKLYHVAGAFDLPDIADGVYRLALAIEDPSCGKPSVLFATRQYQNGGWHPIGYVGINTRVDNPLIPETCFDDQRYDSSITY